VVGALLPRDADHGLCLQPFPYTPRKGLQANQVTGIVRGYGPGAPQARGSFTSSGTEGALITDSDVDSGDVIPFRVQSVSTRIRFPDMADRW
jgi:hypothetical protein